MRRVCRGRVISFILIILRLSLIHILNYVFKDRPNTLRVFVHAPWEFRVEKSREKISGSDEEIEKFLRRDDKRKQDYYRKFAGGDWSDATNYDLCLNAGKLGFEKCVDAILAQMNVMGIK